MGYNEKELKAKLEEEKQTIVLPNKRETIGDILRGARINSGRSIEEISDYLRIKPQYLKALEEDEFNSLPGSAYVIGFIKSYATYLGLDVNNIITQYKQETGSLSVANISLPEDENTLIQDPLINSNHIVIGSVVVVFTLLFVYFINSRSDVDKNAKNQNVEEVIESEVLNKNIEISMENTNLTSSQLSKENDVKNVSEQALISMLEKNNTPEYFETKIDSVILENSPQSKNNDTLNEQVGNVDEVVEEYVGKEYGLENKDDSEIHIKATKKVWVKLKKDGLYKYDSEKGDIGTGETVFEAILNAGDIYYIPDEEDYYLTIGNAQGVDIVADGETIKPLSVKEVSRHNIEMDVEKLKNGTAYVRNRVIE